MAPETSAGRRLPHKISPQTQKPQLERYLSKASPDGRQVFAFFERVRGGMGHVGRWLWEGVYEKVNLGGGPLRVLGGWGEGSADGWMEWTPAG